jgi:DNA polymerase I
MKLLLIDGHALAYRSYFAMIRNPLSNARGENTSAEFGFLRALLALRRDENPDALLVCFDPKGKTFRHKMDPEYKANRPRMPEDLRASLGHISEFLNLAGISQLRIEGYEADDLLASATRRAQREGWEVLLHSGDKDLCQLAAADVTILRPGVGKRPSSRMGPDEVKNEFGVSPERILDYLSLVGDSSDNIPGVAGLGPKGAVKLLAEYGDLESVLDAAANLSPKQREKLEAGRESALHAREMIRLREDLELDTATEDWNPKDGDIEGLRAWLLDRGFQSLISAFEGGEAEAKADYILVQDSRALLNLAQTLREAGRFAVDTETTGLDPRRATMVGLSVSVEEGRAFYLPVDGLCFGEGLPLVEIRKVLAPVFADSSLEKIGQNLKYDAEILERAGLPLAGPFEDTMLLSYCLNPSRRSHGLDALSLELLAHEMIPYSGLFEKGDREKDIRKVPVGILGEYAAEDADYTLRLANLLGPELKKAGLEKLYRELEIPVAEVLRRMETVGIALDETHLSKLSLKMASNLESLVTRIHKEAGREFSIASPKQLSEILFVEMGIKPVKKTKTGYSTDDEVLGELESKHPIAALVREWREISKLKNTYVDSLPLAVNPETGRVHTSFNQAVAATGRLSSSNPNLQNIPIRKELGREIRKAFTAEKGNRLISLDYSQVELRILAELCGDEALREAFAGEHDIHRWTAARLLAKDEGEVLREERDRAKMINYGVLYGMGARGMASRLGIEREEAQVFIDDYFAAFPRIREWTQNLLAQARADGFVSTMMGRVRHLSEINSSNGRLRSFAERAAVNTPIQGSAADLIKLAMLRVDEILRNDFQDCSLLLQVHDELLFEVPEGRVEEIIPHLQDAMETVGDLELPLKVDVGVGHDWLEAH